ncbi:hypothetical protein KGQ71_02885 [Patescibacteria group bacterium]|nr:hypothetical protein [Patescibacteria group bacterium]
MIPLFVAILGFLAGFLSFTLFNALTFLALAAVYALSLYLIFFSITPRLPTFFLIGFTISVETLSTIKLGQAGFLAVFIYLVYYIFQQRLRFTSLFVRYIVALFLAMVGYELFLFPFSFAAERLLILLIAYPVFCLISYFASHFRQSKDYELA